MSNDPTCSGKKAKINPFGEEKKKKRHRKSEKNKAKICEYRKSGRLTIYCTYEWPHKIKL